MSLSDDDFLDSLSDIPLGEETKFPKELFFDDPEGLSPEEQNGNMAGFDLPVPGQGFTGEPGSAKYEQPPQYTKLEDAVDHVYNNIMQQESLNKLLNLLDKGVPASLIAEPLVQHGVQEGYYSTDLALQLIEPVMVIISGLGNRAGINVVLTDGQDDKLRPRKTKEEPVEMPESKGLLKRPKQKFPGNREDRLNIPPAEQRGPGGLV